MYFSIKLPVKFQDCFVNSILESSSKYIILTFPRSKTLLAVQKDSERMWKYERYSLVFEYHNHLHMVPPFALISYIWQLVVYIYSKCTKKENQPLKSLSKLPTISFCLFRLYIFFCFCRSTTFVSSAYQNNLQ